MGRLDAEVIVIGAGPAGSAVAAMLGDAGVHTVLCDRSAFPRDKVCGEGLMPAGVQVLESLDIQTSRFPSLGGVTYRVPGAGAAAGDFAPGRTGRAVRRVALDSVLAERAAASANVDARFGCPVDGVDLRGDGIRVHTPAGVMSARMLVGADGLRSRVARWMGWSRPPRGRRYALAGHVHAPAHSLDRVVVTVLDGREVYAAPTGPDELLLAVLGGKGRVRRGSYAAAVQAAHPDVHAPAGLALRGAGPFWTRPSKVADRGVFLLGDAAGFLDPLTGDGMSDGLVAARELARIVASREPHPEAAYRRWEAGRWRRRVFVNRLALALTGSSMLARRALLRLQQRPATLDRLLQVNDGSESLWSLSWRDWSALAGI